MEGKKVMSYVGFFFLIAAAFHLMIGFGGFTGYFSKGDFKDFDYNFFKNLVLFTLAISMSIWCFYISYKQR